MHQAPQHADPSRATREQLTDEAMMTYLSWLEACADVKDAYADWRAAPRGGRRLAHAAHVAALDREELAAGRHRDAVERISPLSVQA